MAKGAGGDSSLMARRDAIGAPANEPAITKFCRRSGSCRAALVLPIAIGGLPPAGDAGDGVIQKYQEHNSCILRFHITTSFDSVQKNEPIVQTFDGVRTLYCCLLADHQRSRTLAGQ
jgi:hypothetical protein